MAILFDVLSFPLCSFFFPVISSSDVPFSFLFFLNVGADASSSLLVLRGENMHIKC